MQRKSKLREAIEQVKSDAQAITGEAKETVEELKETTREAVPRPVRRRIQKRVDSVLSRRRFRK
jgi:uncharacterized protein YjbJ (UPF0337 family)